MCFCRSTSKTESETNDNYFFSTRSLIGRRGASHVNMFTRRYKGEDKAWRSPTLSMLRPQPRSFYLKGRLGREHVVVESDCKLSNLAGDLQRGGLSPSDAVLTSHFRVICH